MCNTEMVDLDPLSEADLQDLSAALRKHYDYTGSTVAKFVLDDLENQTRNFIKVFPKDYKKVLAATRMATVS
jgi:glutamate synthase (NADPH/NADH) large chain